MARVHFGFAVLSVLAALSQTALAQSEMPPTAGYPDPAPTSGAPTAPTVAHPASAPLPGSSAAPPAPPAHYQAAPPANQAAPPPTYQTAPTGYQAQPATNQAAGTNNGYDFGRSTVSEPLAPPPKPDESDEGFEFPDMSVRVDPLNWIIYGRLGLELEAAVWKFISVEMVPVFVTDSQPPVMNFGSFPGNLYQQSNGLGALSGASIGAGFWLNRKPFSGTVLRLYYTNYGYRYLSKTGDGVLVDEATHTDRHIVAFLGSHSKWGPFTVASGIGLGMEMNRQRRCVSTSGAISTTCPKEVFELNAQGGDVFNVYGWLHPFYLGIRLSLGFVF